MSTPTPNDRPTPESDAAKVYCDLMAPEEAEDQYADMVPLETARTLERARDEAREEGERLKNCLFEIAGTGSSSLARDYMKLPGIAERFLKGETPSKALALIDAHMKVRDEVIAERDQLRAQSDELRRALEGSERVAQITAHRACHSAEHDPANGKLHGYCMVCGVPWPCEYAGTPPVKTKVLDRDDCRKIAYELWNNNWLDKDSIDDAATLIQQHLTALATIPKP